MPQIDNTNIKEFIRLFNAASVNNASQFKFEGHDVLTEWAKYVVEYFAKKGYGDESDRE